MNRDTIRNLVHLLGGSDAVRELTSDLRNTIRRMQPQMVRITMAAPAFNRHETRQLRRNVPPARRHS